VISTQGADSMGIQANATTGTVQVTAANVSTSGQNSTGINATGRGDVTISIPQGSVATQGAQSPGISANSTNGGVQITALGAVSTQGAESPGIGVASTSASVQVTAANVSTTGQGSAAINATGQDNVTISIPQGSVSTQGAQSPGILANSTNGMIQVAASGAISTRGDESLGIWATSTTGPVQVTASNVSTTGQFSTGINATSSGTNGTGGANVTVNVAQGGSVMGGWQPDVTSVGPTYHLPAAGVLLNSTGGVATLTNDGSIGALSDRAIATSREINPQINPPISSSPSNIINNGTITGFVQLGSGDNSIVNNGMFNLRHFADTNGDGVRDTNRVAIADLGTGPNNSFTNASTGTLALVALPVTPTPIIDSTGEYLPLGNPNNTMALGGPLQGHLIGVATFTNSGIIDLQSNPIPGDVLVITGAHQAGLIGSGTYISNGGTLKLDTVLNEGGTATLSDTLVVDGTSVGPLGATKTDIHNAGGKGALTVGDGILVVQVMDPTRSVNGAFALAQPVEVGLVEYGLFYGGVNGRNPGDWFLRNDFTVPITPPTTSTTPPTTPTTPPSDTEPPISTTPPSNVLPTTPPSEPLPAGTYPIIGPRVATYSVVQPIARELGLAMLGTMHERIGDTLTLENASPYAEGWGQSGWVRFFGEQVDKRYQSFTDPSATGRELGMQAGFDVWRGSFIPGHHDAAGVYFAYGNGAVDVNGLVTNPAATAYVFSNTGNLNLQAYSGGAYWTHYGPGGWYLDAVLQGTAYTGDATTIVSKLPIDGTGFIASLEGGYPIPLPLGPNFKLEPQAQIIYQHVGFHDAFDDEATIGLGTTSGATGRLGVRGQWTINTESGRVWQPYVRANVWHNFGAQSALTSPASALSVPLLENTTWVELAGGLTAKMNANFSAYVQFGGEFAVAPSNAKYNGVKGDIGVRWTFGRPPPLVPAPAPVAAPARSYLVFFDWDKATLTDRARRIIREAADNSTRVQYTRIEVNGYTDTSGTPKYNQGLSMRRAQAVQAELIKDGVPANAITIQGFGETHLLVPTGPGVREPQNRRVEIIIR
jgi:outer membrane autotransporter protein